MQFSHILSKRTKSSSAGGRSSVLLNTVNEGLRKGAQVGRFAVDKGVMRGKSARRFIERNAERAVGTGFVVGRKARRALEEVAETTVEAVTEKVAGITERIGYEIEERGGISEIFKSFFKEVELPVKIEPGESFKSVWARCNEEERNLLIHALFKSNKSFSHYSNPKSTSTKLNEKFQKFWSKVIELDPRILFKKEPFPIYYEEGENLVSIYNRSNDQERELLGEAIINYGLPKDLLPKFPSKIQRVKSIAKTKWKTRACSNKKKELVLISYRSEGENEDVQSIDDLESIENVGSIGDVNKKRELIIISHRSELENRVPEKEFEGEAHTGFKVEHNKKELVIISARSAPEQELDLFQSSSNKPKEVSSSNTKISKAFSKIKISARMGQTICSQGMGMRGFPGKAIITDLYKSNQDILNKKRQ